ncbi:hypothetical protein KI387_040078, partial [Taxus chinensis]
AHFEEEETDEDNLGCTWLEKEKGKLVYLIEDEVENLDVDNTIGTCKVLDNANEK